MTTHTSDDRAVFSKLNKSTILNLVFVSLVAVSSLFVCSVTHKKDNAVIALLEQEKAIMSLDSTIRGINEDVLEVISLNESKYAAEFLAKVEYLEILWNDFINISYREGGALEDTSFITEYEPVIRAVRSDTEHIMQIYRQEGKDAAGAYYEDHLDTLFNKITRFTEDSIHLKELAVDQQKQDIRSYHNMLWIFGTALLFVAMLFNFMFNRQLNNSIGAIFIRLQKTKEELQLSAAKLENTEKKSRAWLENSPVCTKIIDLDNNLQYMSCAGINALGIEDITEYYGKPYPLQFYPGPFKNDMIANFEKCKETGEIITQKEVAVIGADGKDLYFDSTFVPVHDDDGQMEYIIAVSSDATERKMQEKALLQSQRMEAVGIMTGGIAHDFNNILTVIAGNAEFLGDEVEADSLQKELLEKIQKAVRRGADLTDRLLSFSRKRILQPADIGVNETVESFLTLITKALSEDIDLKLNLAEDIGNLHIDESQFENALLNLIMNAGDAMPEGGEIMLSTSNVVLDNDSSTVFIKNNAKPLIGSFVTVSVRDSGSGMPKEIMDKVFEPFFTTKEVGKGTGLGLSMVYGFTEQSGGTVTIESKEGEGTCITMFFLCKEQGVEKQLPHQAASAANANQLPKGAMKNVLVVEDDDDLLSYCRTALESFGYNVESAENADKAIDVINKNKKFDLLLTDIAMPGQKNGEELAKIAKKKVPGIKVLYMSGYLNNALIEQGKLKEGVTLIRKPFTRKVLAEEVDKKLRA